MQRPSRFSWSLTVPVPDSKLRYIVFGGDCLPTPARSVVEPVADDWELRLAPKEIVNPLPGVDYDKLIAAWREGLTLRLLGPRFLAHIAADGAGEIVDHDQGA